MHALILFSGGLDSTLMLAMALKQGRECTALSFDYGQRHRVELESAKALAVHFKVPHKIIRIDPEPFGKTPLSGGANGPMGRTTDEIVSDKISPYYVPGRNTLFLAYALSYSETIGADEIWIGCNADDRSFPDCSEGFRNAFQGVMNCAIAGRPPTLVAPLAKMHKSEIVKTAIDLGVPIERTHSCYAPYEGRPCGQCDACVIRNISIEKDRAPRTNL